jgi:hypothetical protein
MESHEYLSSRTKSQKMNEYINYIFGCVDFANVEVHALNTQSRNVIEVQYRSCDFGQIDDHNLLSRS